MKHKNVKPLMIVFIMFGTMILLLCLFRIKRELDTFYYNRHLDDTIVTVDDTEIKLRDFSYYVYVVEDYFDKQALAYNPDNPKEYWNIFMKAGEDSQFVTTIAKQTLRENFITEYLFALEASANGIELTDEETRQAESEAYTIYDELTGSQISNSGLTLKAIETGIMNRDLARKYASYLDENGDFTGYMLSHADELKYDSNYFNDKIAANHTVTFNDVLWNQITLGEVTVNIE